VRKLIQRLDRINVLIEVLLIIFRLKLFTQEKLEIFINVHVNFVNEPRDEFVRIVVLIVIEKGISCTDPGDKSPVVYHTSVTFGLINVLKELI
jgi:hypothetical protein